MPSPEMMVTYSPEFTEDVPIEMDIAAHPPPESVADTQKPEVRFTELAMGGLWAIPPLIVDTPLSLTHHFYHVLTFCIINQALPLTPLSMTRLPCQQQGGGTRTQAVYDYVNSPLAWAFLLPSGLAFGRIPPKASLWTPGG